MHEGRFVVFIRTARIATEVLQQPSEFVFASFQVRETAGRVGIHRICDVDAGQEPGKGCGLS